MIRKIFYLLPLVLLTACSTVIEGPTQEVRIETPGVEGGICFIEQSHRYRRRVWVPQSVTILRSDDPLEITCLAPGNRQKKITVEPVPNRMTFLNAATAGAGALVDYETGAMFDYPELVVVDFTDMPPRPMPLPAYQELIKKYPELADIEEFRPGVPAMQRDRYNPVPQLRPREVDGGLFSDTGLTEVRTPANEGVFLSPGGNATAESLTRQMNPDVFGEEAAPAGNGFAGGTAVIGSEADLATHPPVPLDPSGLPASESSASPEEEAP